MDQGGIYEDGTPDKIFNDPEKELTRRFVRNLRVLEFDIDNEDEYDSIAYDNETDRYCMKNDIPARLKYRIRLAIEEIVQQQLLPHGACFPIHISVEYSATDGAAVVTISYGGAEFDPADGDNQLSYLLNER